MNNRQRESTAKYLYDISKGTTLIAVIGNIMAERLNLRALILGITMTLIFYVWAYLMEEKQ